MNTRTAGFALRHPIIAARIGTVSHGSTNISTVSTRFAINSGVPENSAREGSHVNAFRHTLWQASITSEFDASIASQVGNAHEANPFPPQLVFHLSVVVCYHQQLTFQAAAQLPAFRHKGSGIRRNQSL